MPHFHRLAFRTPRNIIATLDQTVRDLNLMFDPELRDFYFEQAPKAFNPVPDGWGVNRRDRAPQSVRLCPHL